MDTGEEEDYLGARISITTRGTIVTLRSLTKKTKQTKMVNNVRRLEQVCDMSLLQRVLIPHDRTLRGHQTVQVVQQVQGHHALQQLREVPAFRAHPKGKPERSALCMKMEVQRTKYTVFLCSTAGSEFQFS